MTRGYYEAIPCPLPKCERMHGARWVTTPRRGQDLEAERSGGADIGGPAHTGPTRPVSLGQADATRWPRVEEARVQVGSATER